MSLRFAILTALIDTEQSGYDLAKDFDHSLGFFWQASHQQIYRELKKLSEERLLSSRAQRQAGRPDRIVYALTEAGRSALDRWVLAEDRMRVHEVRDDFYIKLYNTSAENVPHLIASLEQRRDWMHERLSLYLKIRERRYAQPERLSLRRRGVYLALLAGIKSCEAYLDWCAQARELLLESVSGSAIAASPAEADTA